MALPLDVLTIIFTSDIALLCKGLRLNKQINARLAPIFLYHIQPPTVDERQAYLKGGVTPLIFFQFGHKQQIINFRTVAEDEAGMLESLGNSFFSFFITKRVIYDIEIAASGINPNGRLSFDIIPTYESMGECPDSLPSLLGLKVLYQIYRQRPLNIAKRLVQKQLSMIENQYQSWSANEVLARFHFYHYLRINAEALELRHPGYNVYNFLLVDDRILVYTEHRLSVSTNLDWLDDQIKFLLHAIKTSLNGLPE